jgi:CheY-like chemotaxis protein
MHLLLVDDNPGDVLLVRETITTPLAQGTLQFSTVPTGTDALAFLRRQAPYTNVAAPDLVRSFTQRLTLLLFLARAVEQG